MRPSGWLLVASNSLPGALPFLSFGLLPRVPLFAGCPLRACRSAVSAPPRGETIAETKRPDPVPPPRAPSHDGVTTGATAPLVPRPPSPPPPDLVSEEL